MRHLEIEELWMQQEVHRKRFKIEKVRGIDNTADIGTKAVPKEASEYYMWKMGFEEVRSEDVKEGAGRHEKGEERWCEEIGKKTSVKGKGRGKETETREGMREWEMHMLKEAVKNDQKMQGEDKGREGMWRNNKRRTGRSRGSSSSCRCRGRCGRSPPECCPAP